MPYGEIETHPVYYDGDSHTYPFKGIARIDIGGEVTPALIEFVMHFPDDYLNGEPLMLDEAGRKAHFQAFVDYLAEFPGVQDSPNWGPGLEAYRAHEGRQSVTPTPPE